MALEQSEWDEQTGGHIGPVYIYIYPTAPKPNKAKLHFKPVRQVRCQADTRVPQRSWQCRL